MRKLKGNGEKKKRFEKGFCVLYVFDGFWLLSLGRAVNLHRSAVGFTLAHDRERSLIDFLGWVKEISLEFGVD
jgi:hypothetical protein